MNDFSVKISYLNKNLEKVSENTYDLSQYTEIIKLELLRILMDIEDAFYALQDNKSKDEWSKDVSNCFQKIRHKILDQANAIERLPKNIFYKNVPIQSIKFSEVLANIIDNANLNKET